MHESGDHLETGASSWTLAQLVAWLREQGAIRSQATMVGGTLASRRVTWESVRPYVRLPREGYTRTLVYREAEFEVLVLTWSAGASSSIHDHAGQACWMIPVLGVLEATGWRRVGGRARPGRARIEPEGPPRLLVPGMLEVAHPGTDGLHEVRTAPGTALAVSVHVYAKPIARAQAYDVARGRCTPKVLRDDAVGPLHPGRARLFRGPPKDADGRAAATPPPPAVPRRPGFLRRLFQRQRRMVPTTARASRAKLALTDVEHSYGNDVEALRGVFLDVHSGEFVCLLGPSGCGKSTLLYALAGHIAPTGGKVTLDGDPITGPGPDRLLMFQEAALYPWMTVEQNITFVLRGRGLSRHERRERARAFLGWVQLSGFEHAMPHQLSGGMKMRASLARALAVDAPVLLMDEPFGSLDAQTRESMHRLLESVWMETRKTIVFVTHDVTEALVLASRLVVMAPRPGRIVRDLELRLPAVRRPEDPSIQALARQVRRMIRESDQEGAGDGGHPRG